MRLSCTGSSTSSSFSVRQSRLEGSCWQQRLPCPRAVPCQFLSTGTKQLITPAHTWFYHQWPRALTININTTSQFSTSLNAKLFCAKTTVIKRWPLHVAYFRIQKAKAGRLLQVLSQLRDIVSSELG